MTLLLHTKQVAVITIVNVPNIGDEVAAVAGTYQTGQQRSCTRS